MNSKFNEDEDDFDGDDDLNGVLVESVDYEYEDEKQKEPVVDQESTIVPEDINLLIEFLFEKNDIRINANNIGFEFVFKLTPGYEKSFVLQTDPNIEKVKKFEFANKAKYDIYSSPNSNLLLEFKGKLDEKKLIELSSKYYEERKDGLMKKAVQFYGNKVFCNFEELIESKKLAQTSETLFVD